MFFARCSLSTSWVIKTWPLHLTFIIIIITKPHGLSAHWYRARLNFELSDAISFCPSPSCWMHADRYYINRSSMSSAHLLLGLPLLFDLSIIPNTTRLSNLSPGILNTWPKRFCIFSVIFCTVSHATPTYDVGKTGRPSESCATGAVWLASLKQHNADSGCWNRSEL